MARHRRRGEPARARRRRGRRRDAGDRGELLPHRELHVRGRGGAGPARRGRERPRGRGRSASSRPSRSACRSTSASSSSARAAICATVLEAVLKLREGAHVAAEAHHTEQLLHGHLAAIDDIGALLRARGRGPRGGARRRRGRGARASSAATTTLVPTSPSGRRHRPLPAAHGRPRGRPRRRPGPDPPGRGALGQGPEGVRLAGSGLRAGRRSGAPASARRSRPTCCRRGRSRGRSACTASNVEVALELRRLLRPRDPEPVGRIERRLQPGKRRSSSARLVVKKTTTPGARLRAQLLRERRPRVVPVRHREVGERGEQPVDLVLGVVVDDPRADGAVVEPEVAHRLERVVVAVPDREVALGERRGGVLGRAHRER